MEACVSTSYLLVLGFVLLLIFVVWALSIRKNQESGASFDYHPPAVASIESGYPYPVGSRVQVGKSDDVTAFLIIKKYDDGEYDVYCDLLIEIPQGATNPFVNHEDNDDLPLGIASVHYQMGTDALKHKIRLENEELYISSYRVLINVVRTAEHKI
jgi:hypothetical protein